MPKTILEIWKGEGTDPSSLFQTVELDRDSRRFVHVQVTNII